MSLPQQPRCFITGAGIGLGRELALQLARKHRARLWLGDIDMESAKTTATLAKEQGAIEAQGIACDVRHAESLGAAANVIVTNAGGIDLLINNAGVAVAGSFEDISIENWQWCVDTNLWGVVYGCRTFLPLLKAQGSGHILNIASAAGLLSPPKLGPYNVAKAAVIAASETLRAECQGTGVGVTVACPTFFPTAIYDNARTTTPHLTDLARQLTSWSGLSAEDVARACLKAVDRNKLYVVPSHDARILWSMKRALPTTFTNLTRNLLERFERRHLKNSKNK